MRKSRGLHISPENSNCMIVCFLNYICLLSSFPVLLASSKQLDSAHQHQLDVLLIKSSDKQAWAFSLGKEGAEVCRHLAGSKNNTRMMAQEASPHKSTRNKLILILALRPILSSSASSSSDTSEALPTSSAAPSNSSSELLSSNFFLLIFLGTTLMVTVFNS